MKIKKQIKPKFREKSGQATVELAVVFPVVLIVAVIAVNVLTFFSYCSSFDRTFKQSVACLGSSPAYGESIGNIKSYVEKDLKDTLLQDYLDFNISVESVSGGFYCFDGSLIMSPTLFGMGLRDEILGIPLPKLTHRQQLKIDVYKPGVIF